MATETVPIELPTGRRSYIQPVQAAPNVNDPNWIPVLSDVDLQKLSQYVEKEVTPHTPTASYSPFPPRPSSPPKQRPQLTHSYSKSSLAPETVPSELEAEFLPPRTSSRKGFSPLPMASDPAEQHLRQTSSDAPSSDGQETVTSDGAAEASAAPSTVGTVSLLEEQYYTLPEAPITKEDILPPQIMSGRSSVASARTKSGVMPPTSKYNRKPAPSVAGSVRPPAIKSRPTTPHDSPRTSATLPTSTTSLPLVEPLPAPQVPFGGEAPPTPDLAQKVTSSKSTASERRQRALHSHPSNVSLHAQVRSRANSTSEESGIVSKPPSVKHKPRKSTDSRAGTPRSTIYDGPTPTPAPTTPLPDLPPEARTRPTTREGLGIKQIQSPPEAHFAGPKSPIKTSDHTRMASFMTTNSTVIFRRFDDVHVRLLLCLQDEIAQLEKELLGLEGGVPGGGDRNAQGMRIMRELRRVVAEYDHLFANWSQMQANKADKTVMRDLRQWLENPNTSAGAGMGGVREDLAWLENSKDLSSVQLGNFEKVPGSKDGDGAGRGGGGGGFAGLFHCAGKRK